jgi:azurin
LSGTPRRLKMQYPSSSNASPPVPVRYRRLLLVCALATPISLFAYRRSASSAQKKSIELAIASDGDLLAFKPDRLTCPTGAHIHLTLYHTGKYLTQDHNWVLTRPGEAHAVEEAAVAAGAKSGWVPKGDGRVLAATPLCGKGQHVSVSFVAPTPGDYPFLCTNPGHGAVMHGILHVTAR